MALRTDIDVEVAAAAVRKLEEMHQEFIQFIAALTQKKVNAGELDTDGRQVLVTCLGVRTQASHRPIARDGYPIALEYPFLVQHRERSIVVWRMFLEADYSLYADANQQDRICGSNNQHLSSYIIQQFASALLRSPIFAPLAE